MCFPSHFCSCMFELHSAEWCMCKVWHKKAVFTFIADGVNLANRANWLILRGGLTSTLLLWRITEATALYTVTGGSFQPRDQAPSKGHKKNGRGRKMIKVLRHKLVSFFGNWTESSLFSEIFSNFTRHSHKKLFEWNDWRSLEVNTFLLKLVDIWNVGPH